VRLADDREAAGRSQRQGIAAETAADAARREAEEREHTWHELMDQARERLIETHRATQLRAQADAWDEACRLRRYCDAIDVAHGDHPPTAQWLAWARAHATQLDPLTDPRTMHAAPEATPETLQPHLPDGWSALGPEHHYPPHALGNRYGS
jgi:hypothetical protein